jgi:hypothetical protein
MADLLSPPYWRALAAAAVADAAEPAPLPLRCGDKGVAKAAKAESAPVELPTARLADLKQQIIDAGVAQVGGGERLWGGRGGLVCRLVGMPVKTSCGAHPPSSAVKARFTAHGPAMGRRGVGVAVAVAQPAGGAMLAPRSWGRAPQAMATTKSHDITLPPAPYLIRCPLQSSS